MTFSNYFNLSIRSVGFYAGLIAITMTLGLLSFFTLILPLSVRHQIFTVGNGAILKWLYITCGIDTKVTGLDNIPPDPYVAICNHQSAWESFFLQRLLNPTSFVLKKELLWLPFFGWSVAVLQPIAINRSTPRKAIKHILSEGHKRLNDNINVVIYPEGTRQAAGEIGSFKTGAAVLAKQAGVAILPIAHNSGSHWPVNRWLKTPGSIRLVIGAPINTTSGTEKELSKSAQSWVADELSKMTNL